MAKDHIEAFVAGSKQLSAAHLNKLVRDARREITGTFPVVVNRVGNTTNVSLGNIPLKWWIGKTYPSDATGSDSAYTDEHYHVKKQKISSTDTSDLTFAGDTFPSDVYYTVTNLAESDTHNLADGTKMIVFEIEDAGGDTRYVIVMEPSDAIIHTLLYSDVHTDTTTKAYAADTIIYGNSDVSKWDRLDAPTSDYMVLIRSDTGHIAWNWVRAHA